jgi:hypothetical protein
MKVVFMLTKFWKSKQFNFIFKVMFFNFKLRVIYNVKKSGQIQSKTKITIF